MKYRFVQDNAQDYPVRIICRVMKVGKSAFYAWKARPAPLMTAGELRLYRRAKELFSASRESLGSRELAKNLRAEGIEITRHHMMKVMRALKLEVKQRVAYKVTTQRKHSDAVADNLLNQNFNPAGKDQIWAGDITYLKTAEGWMYLAVVMDLYSRRIIGWSIDKRMTTSLISRALIKAYNIRRPGRGVVFHSDRGSQYTSKLYRKLLAGYDIRASMGDVGACWDNAVVERFFGSLKYDWIFKVYQPTRKHMTQDVAAYIKYYNLNRLHSSNNNLSPVQFEKLSTNSVRFG